MVNTNRKASVVAKLMLLTESAHRVVSRRANRQSSGPKKIAKRMIPGTVTAECESQRPNQQHGTCIREHRVLVHRTTGESLSTTALVPSYAVEHAVANETNVILSTMPDEQHGLVASPATYFATVLALPRGCVRALIGI
jgi:hypothetical protein